MENIHTTSQNGMIEDYLSFIGNPQFPCIAAKAASHRNQITCMVAGNMACPFHDRLILQFVYDFISDYRQSTTLYHSATIIFDGPDIRDEEHFDTLLWQRLQSLADLDALSHVYDTRVSADPSSPNFSFSLMGEALFVIGLHPASSRITRRFKHPTLVFNPHQQFETLRKKNRYESMKKTVRKRDIKLSGSINPMLDDYGSSSETMQYSGRKYAEDWKCPLQLSHANIKHHPTT